MHWTPGKCPQLRLQTCTAHFHSTQLDCLSHLTWLVKSYPSLLMGNMEGQKTKYNGPTHPIFFPSEQQILNSEMTRQSRLKELPEKEKLSRGTDLKEKNQPVCACHGRGSGADSLTQKALKSQETWSGLCKTISAVKRESHGHPVMGNGMEGERHVLPVLNLQHYCPERIFHSLEKNFLNELFHSVFILLNNFILIII